MQRGWTGIETLVVLAILGILVALCLPVFFLLSAKTIPDHGIVIYKRFHAAHTSYTYLPQTTGKYTHTQVVPRFVPEKYGVVIQADGTADDDGRYYIDVTKQRYDSLKPGDVWDRVQIEAEKSP